MYKIKIKNQYIPRSFPNLKCMVVQLSIEVRQFFLSLHINESHSPSFLVRDESALRNYTLDHLVNIPIKQSLS